MASQKSNIILSVCHIDRDARARLKIMRSTQKNNIRYRILFLASSLKVFNAIFIIGGLIKKLLMQIIL
jgi:hypothetical protein